MFAEAPDREYEQFYRATVPKLVKFLIALGMSSADAVDVVQDTMIEALPPRLATLDNPYGWCRLVAHRKACALWKRRHELPEGELEGLGHVMVGTLPDTAEIESRIELVRLLSELGSAAQRAVLVWTFDGATTAEIASALGMHPATVRSTLRNARQAMRRLRERERTSDER